LPREYKSPLNPAISNLQRYYLPGVLSDFNFLLCLVSPFYNFGRFKHYRGRVDLSGTGDTILDHTYKAESSGVYRILINSTWPENQMAGCAGQDAGVQYEYTVKR
jgi:hypothetical protein